MEAKQKADELIIIYNALLGNLYSLSNTPKHCALKSVDETISRLEIIYSNIDDMDLGNKPKGYIDIEIDWYKEVRSEILNQINN